MKLKYLSFILLCVIVSCGENEPDFIGTYRSTSLRDECPDISNNASVTSDENGICLAISGGEKCISLTLSISEDGSFTFITSQNTLMGGQRTNSTPNSQSGTYTTIQNEITLNPDNGVSIMMTLNDAENSLDWNVAVTNVGCNRIYKLDK